MGLVGRGSVLYVYVVSGKMLQSELGYCSGGQKHMTSELTSFSLSLPCTTLRAVYALYTHPTYSSEHVIYHITPDLKCRSLRKSSQAKCSRSRVAHVYAIRFQYK